MLTREEKILLKKRDEDFLESFSILWRKSKMLNKTFLDGKVCVPVDDDGQFHPDKVEIYPDIPLRRMQESDSSSKFSYSHCTQARININIKDD